MPERWLSLLNWLVLRHRIARESADALRNLKQVMEQHQHEAASVNQPKSVNGAPLARALFSRVCPS